MAQLTAELIASCGVAPLGLKLERLETYDGAKYCDIDTWLFQAKEHMLLIRIVESHDSMTKIGSTVVESKVLQQTSMYNSLVGPLV